MTKEELQREMSKLRAEIATDFRGLRADLIRWMFIFWSSQLVAIAGMLFVFVKLLRP